MAVVVTIGIVWRFDGKGKGAFWDHHRMQTHFPECETKILAPPSKHSAIKANFEKHLEGRTSHLPSHSGSPGFANPQDVTVIVLPGVAQGADEDWRSEYEVELLRSFMGVKPMLLICGAVYRLADTRLGDMKLGVTVGEAKLHSNSRMVSQNDVGEVVYNTNIHFVELTEHGAQRLSLPFTEFPVNSVHDRAITGLTNDTFVTLAKSTRPVPLKATGGEIRIRKNRAAQAMISTPGMHEAVLSNWQGAPLLAVQWHLEAYPRSMEAHHKLLALIVEYKAPEQQQQQEQGQSAVQDIKEAQLANEIEAQAEVPPTAETEAATDAGPVLAQAEVVTAQPEPVTAQAPPVTAQAANYAGMNTTQLRKLAVQRRIPDRYASPGRFRSKDELVRLLQDADAQLSQLLRLQLELAPGVPPAAPEGDVIVPAAVARQVNVANYSRMTSGQVRKLAVERRIPDRYASPGRYRRKDELVRLLQDADAQLAPGTA